MTKASAVLAPLSKLTPLSSTPFSLKIPASIWPNSSPWTKLTNEGGATSETRDCNGDVGRSTAGSFEKPWGLSEGDAGFGGDQVNEHLAEAHDEAFLSGGRHRDKMEFVF